MAAWRPKPDRPRTAMHRSGGVSRPMDSTSPCEAKVNQCSMVRTVAPNHGGVTDSLNPNLDLRDDEYVARLDRRLSALTAAKPLGLADLCPRMGGAFPDLIAAIGRERVLAQPANGARLHEARPHESPGRGEWFFTEETSEALGSRARGSGSALLLGTPSVSEHVDGGLLIDSSPYAAERFAMGAVVQMLSTVESAEIGEDQFDWAVVDPPWYGPAVIDWLARASRWVRQGGLVNVVLFGDLTRPSAARERAIVMDIASQIGDVEIEPGSISYRTPRFEQRALVAAGLPPLPDWRRADLLMVRKCRALDIPLQNEASSDWIDYRLGDHIICARRSSLARRPSHGPALEPVASATPGWTAATVSRRAPEIMRADLWTSDNTVARVNDWPAVMSMIHEFNRGGEPAECTAKLFAQLFGGQEC